MRQKLARSVRGPHGQGWNKRRVRICATDVLCGPHVTNNACLHRARDITLVSKPLIIRYASTINLDNNSLGFNL